MVGSELKEFNSNVARLNSSIWFDEDLPFHVSNLAGHQGIPIGSRRGTRSLLSIPKSVDSTSTPHETEQQAAAKLRQLKKGHISFTTFFNGSEDGCL